ncbi:hypothetical protein [Glycomyces sp. NPDC047010]|uniref:hypothetical protein n=1 Tax=Glycomyces sp. NPDC047010 TaxID=3155023 RepID=UPI0033DDED7B
MKPPPDGNRIYSGHGLLGLVRDLIEQGRFDPQEFVIAGSARLWVEGYIPALSDLDIVAIGSTWDNAWEMALSGEGVFFEGPLNHAKLIRLHGNRIEVSNSWLSPYADPYRLIEEAEIIEGLRYPSLATVADYKRRLGRPKDQTDLSAITSSTARYSSPATASGRQRPAVSTSAPQPLPRRIQRPLAHGNTPRASQCRPVTTRR